MRMQVKDLLQAVGVHRSKVYHIIALIVVGANDGAAQPAKQPPNLSFPPGLPGSPAHLFESMFGPATDEEQKLLAAVKVSISEERSLGQMILDSYLSDLKLRKIRVVRKGRDVEYLQRLVETIRPLMTNPKRYPQLTIYVIDSPDVDARSIPGGTLIFTKGLLEFAGSEAALIGILGHELSHLDREHLLLPLKRTKILQTKSVPQGAFDPQQFFANGTMMMRLMARPFRPEDEAKADRDGTAWAFSAGYDPRQLADLFARLHVKNQDQKVPWGHFFRTHPYNEDRFAAIMLQYDELKKKSDADSKLYIGIENLKQRVARTKQDFQE